MKKQFGLVREIRNAGKYRQVKKARAKSRAEVCVLVKAHILRGEVIHLVRYWIETDSVTIHRYSANFYYNNFPGPGVFFRKKKTSRRLPGYSRKWENL